MSAARKGKRPTLGTRRTPEQKARMKAAWVVRRSASTFLSDEEKAARQKARDACKRMLRRVMLMARVRKDKKIEMLLGYTKEDLRSHLESQFRGGMSWANRDSFHIDHIKPMAAFFAEGVFDPVVINALSNLQVLTPLENRLKSDKYQEA